MAAEAVAEVAEAEVAVAEAVAEAAEAEAAEAAVAEAEAEAVAEAAVAEAEVAEAAEAEVAEAEAEVVAAGGRGRSKGNGLSDCVFRSAARGCNHVPGRSMNGLGVRSRFGRGRAIRALSRNVEVLGHPHRRCHRALSAVSEQPEHQ